MNYEILVSPELAAFFKKLDAKSYRVVKNGLRKLEEHPYPGRGLGDKEWLTVRGRTRCRLHIGRTWTVFYSILEDRKQVRISEILPIGEAHKRYEY